VDWRAKSKRKMNDGVVYIAHPSGARACVHLHGAHLTSWKTANGTEQIFLSKKAIFEPPKAIRGGVPVCFPQFSDFGELSKSHGFARNERWTLFEREGDTVTLKLSSNDGVDFDSKYGCKDHFVISLKYTINETQISTQLEVTNTSPTSAMTYSLALHTYLRVEDITHTSIQGLYRVGYLDSLDGREMKSESNSVITVNEEVDRIYLSTPPTVKIVDKCGKRSLCIKKFNLPDIVVWNPWIDKSKRMGDFGDEEYKEMICVETGCIKPPIELLPGTKWRAEQIITATHNNQEPEEPEDKF